jgi:hypothetical protein
VSTSGNNGPEINKKGNKKKICLKKKIELLFKLKNFIIIK